MLIGKRIILKRGFLGLESINGKHHPVSIPAGAFLEFISEPAYENGLATVLWNTREVAIFLSQLSGDESETLLQGFHW